MKFTNRYIQGVILLYRIYFLRYATKRIHHDSSCTKPPATGAMLGVPRWMKLPIAIKKQKAHSPPMKLVTLCLLHFLRLEEERRRVSTKNRPFADTFAAMLTETDMKNLGEAWKILDQDFYSRKIMQYQGPKITRVDM